MTNRKPAFVCRASETTSISIHNLRLRTILGVYEKERLTEREVVVNMRYDVAQSCSGIVDLLESTVDYSVIRDRLVAVAKDSRARLLEHLAERMLQAVIEDTRIQTVTLRLDKPGALKQADSVSVTKEWARYHDAAGVAKKPKGVAEIALLEAIR